MSLQGDMLAAPKVIADRIVIPANDVLEFTLQNVSIEEFMFDMDLSFQLTWKTTSYAEDDLEHLVPIVTDHIISAPIRVERFVEPVMTVTFEPDVTLAREGDTVTVTYTLVNDTKFDMTNINLQDTGIPQPVIQLEKTALNAGETMVVQASFKMGNGAVELHPTAKYTVRGVESSASAASEMVVEHVNVSFRMEVEKYPATSEGTLFRITLMNEGSHAMTDIRVADEIGTVIAEGLSLEAGKERTISCTVPTAVSSGVVRYISFEASGRDAVGGTVTAKSPAAYELLPFVESGQVRLLLNVALTASSLTDDGSNRLKLLFEVRNDSQVPITDAVITEGDYFKGVVNRYEELSTGVTTFEKEMIVPAGTRSLTFVLMAMDPAQTQYASEPMVLDLTPLSAPRATNPPAIQPGKTVDTTGTIYDTERYIKLFRMAALIAMGATLVFLMLSMLFRVAETNVRRLLPREAMARPFGPRKAPAEPVAEKESSDPVHDLFGYMQPAKLRYMDRTDRFPAIRQEEATPEPAPVVQPPVTSSTGSLPVPEKVAASRKAGVITAVPVRKNRSRPVMLSSDDTQSFAPVREGQSQEAGETKTAEVKEILEAEGRPSAAPRVVEVKKDPRVLPKKKLEIIRVRVRQP